MLYYRSLLIQYLSGQSKTMVLGIGWAMCPFLMIQNSPCHAQLLPLNCVSYLSTIP